MEIRFTRSVEDVTDVIRWASMRAWVVAVLALLSIILFCEGIYLLSQGFVGAYFWLAASVVLAFAPWVVPRLLARRAMARHLRRTGSNSEVTYLFQDDGVSVSGENGKAQLRWRTFSKFEETERTFLVCFRSGSFNSIPKRVMSAEQITELRRILELRIEKSPK